MLDLDLRVVGEVAVVLGAVEAQELTKRIRANTLEAKRLIVEAHRGRVWVPLGYSGFADWLRGEFGWSHTRGYQLLHLAAVEDELRQIAPFPDNFNLADTTCRTIIHHGTAWVMELLGRVVNPKSSPTETVQWLEEILFLLDTRERRPFAAVRKKVIAGQLEQRERRHEELRAAQETLNGGRHLTNQQFAAIEAIEASEEADLFDLPEPVAAIEPSEDEISELLEQAKELEAERKENHGLELLPPAEAERLSAPPTPPVALLPIAPKTELRPSVEPPAPPVAAEEGLVAGGAPAPDETLTLYASTLAGAFNNLRLPELTPQQAASLLLTLTELQVKLSKLRTRYDQNTEATV